jgi:hypothetical protein
LVMKESVLDDSKRLDYSTWGFGKELDEVVNRIRERIDKALKDKGLESAP